MLNRQNIINLSCGVSIGLLLATSNMPLWAAAMVGLVVDILILNNKY